MAEGGGLLNLPKSSLPRNISLNLLDRTKRVSRGARSCTRFAMAHAEHRLRHPGELARLRAEVARMKEKV